MPQRLFPRIRTSVPVTFDCGRGVVRGRTENLSLRGMRIAASRTPEIGTVLAVSLELPGGRTTRIDGRVVFLDPPQIDGASAFALELVHPSEEYAAFLGLLVAAQVRKGPAKA